MKSHAEHCVHVLTLCQWLLRNPVGKRVYVDWLLGCGIKNWKILNSGNSTKAKVRKSGFCNIYIAILRLLNKVCYANVRCIWYRSSSQIGCRQCYIGVQEALVLVVSFSLTYILGFSEIGCRWHAYCLCYVLLRISSTE